VGIDMFVRHGREHSHGFAGLGYGQSVSQFLASRAVVDSANAWNKAARKVPGSRLRAIRRELRSVPAVSRYLGFQAFKSLA
jgi:hypothetical protein